MRIKVNKITGAKSEKCTIDAARRWILNNAIVVRFPIRDHRSSCRTLNVVRNTSSKSRIPVPLYWAPSLAIDEVIWLRLTAITSQIICSLTLLSCSHESANKHPRAFTVSSDSGRRPITSTANVLIIVINRISLIETVPRQIARRDAGTLLYP